MVDRFKPNSFDNGILVYFNLRKFQFKSVLTGLDCVKSRHKEELMEMGERFSAPLYHTKLYLVQNRSHVEL